MADFSDAMNIAASGMRAQATRLRHVSENIANADTPGYQRKTISFESLMEAGQTTGVVETGNVRLDRSDLKQIYDPSHPLADENGRYLQWVKRKSAHRNRRLPRSPAQLRSQSKNVRSGTSDVDVLDGNSTSLKGPTYGTTFKPRCESLHGKQTGHGP